MLFLAHQQGMGVGDNSDPGGGSFVASIGRKNGVERVDGPDMNMPTGLTGVLLMVLRGLRWA